MKLQNPIHMARCDLCKWSGKKSELKDKGFSKAHSCPGCGKKWNNKRPGESFRRSVLTYFAVEGNKQ